MIYFDREGRRISPDKWHMLRADHLYTVLREFKNDKVLVRLRWHGALTEKESKSFRDTWPLFHLIVMNADANGVFQHDPVIDGKTFAYEGTAVAAYEHFLVTWTECTVNEHGDFVEEGNDLAPPAPPNPDVPTSVFPGTGVKLVAW